MDFKMENMTKYSKDIDTFKTLYNAAFPKEERIPMKGLLRKTKKDYIDLFAFYDQEIFVGFTYIVTYKDITLVFYLAIDDNYRSKGYGRKALAKIKEHYPNHRIILNIEAVDEKADNYEQRIKRKKFYERNGYSNLEFNVKEGGVLYEVLINGDTITFGEYRELMKKYTGPILSWIFKPTYFLYERNKKTL